MAMTRVSRRVLLAVGALALAAALAWTYQTGRLPGFPARYEGPVAGRSGGGRGDREPSPSPPRRRVSTTCL